MRNLAINDCCDPDDLLVMSVGPQWLEVDGKKPHHVNIDITVLGDSTSVFIARPDVVSLRDWLNEYLAQYPE